MNTTVPSDSVIVLLSGGLDSTVALADVLTRQPVACALTFNYGQRSVFRELQASRSIADHYGLMHRVIALPWLADLLPQALTPLDILKHQNIQPEAELSPDALMAVERVWVPNRNGLFLNIAATFAEAYKLKTVVFGANAEEGMDFPDNTPAFRDQLNHTFLLSTLIGVQVETPLGEMNKAAIIQRGMELGVPFHLIWSCYEGNDQQCGQCPSCLRVKNAKTEVEAVSGQAISLNFEQSVAKR